MAEKLDESTLEVVLLVLTLTVLVVAASNLYAQFVVIPKILAQSKQSDPTSGPPLIVGSIVTLCLMLAASAILTVPIVVLGNSSDAEDVIADRASHLELTSSINFCEEDFIDSAWIAEPANTASSVASYCPLALWGMFGTPSYEWSTRVAGHKRIFVAYATLFTIGIGSTLLHALLTASAQGGDELPMLWFTAASSFICLDLVLQGIPSFNPSAMLSKWLHPTCTTPVDKQDRWILHWLVTISAAVATVIYVSARENFLPFYIMFCSYSWITIVGLNVLFFVVKWNGDDQFRAKVFLPLGVCTGWVAIFAKVSWVAEMFFCGQAQQGDWGPLAQWVWNRGFHPLWHCSSALLAYLLVQIYVAGQGFQRGWGQPVLKWKYAPYVAFQEPIASGKKQS